jgi:hypothetical protein
MQSLDKAVQEVLVDMEVLVVDILVFLQLQ